MLDYFRLNYIETAKIAEASGAVIPAIDVSQEQVFRLYDIAEYCKKFYTEWEVDADLTGLFLFRMSDQTRDEEFDGTNISYSKSGKQNGERNCVIGLAVEIIDENNTDYLNFVFLHELAHLDKESKGHDEEFEMRFSTIMYDYFHRAARHDSKRGTIGSYRKH